MGGDAPTPQGGPDIPTRDAGPPVTSQETPHPPATAEFGAVTPGGPSHVYPESDGLAVTKFSVEPYDNNVYVLSADGDALIVDGANDADRILAEVRGRRVRAIVQTHGHFDHVQALEKLVAELGVPVYAHAGDARKMPVPTQDLGEGDELAVGAVPVRVMHTPGHTPGSLSFVAGSFLFSGDTLFPGGPGRSDSAAALQEMIGSIKTRLLSLDDQTLVYPGHGANTTIGDARREVAAFDAREHPADLHGDVMWEGS
jgi:hydroxyacylglutathione hydrolase